MARKDFLVLAIVWVLLLPPVIYGVWAAKHVSYAWFYRDMVEQTVRDMVKASALREGH